jgi:hypothetical protein
MRRLPSLATCKIVLRFIVAIVAVVAQSRDTTPTTTTTVYAYQNIGD